MKHTKGNWTVNTQPFTHIESDGKWICQLNDLKNDKPFLTHEYKAEEINLKEQEKANAKLMAASPRLLKALGGLVNQCEWIPKDALNPQALKEMREAIEDAREVLKSLEPNP